MPSKLQSVRLTDHTLTAVRPGDSLSHRLNQVVDRYLTILEVSREAARAYFSEDQWDALREANARRPKSLGVGLHDVTMLAEFLPADLAIALDKMPVWQTFVILEMLEAEPLTADS